MDSAGHRCPPLAAAQSGTKVARSSLLDVPAPSGQANPSGRSGEHPSRGGIVGGDGNEVNLAVVVDLFDTHDRPEPLGASQKDARRRVGIVREAVRIQPARRRPGRRLPRSQRPRHRVHDPRDLARAVRSLVPQPRPPRPRRRSGERTRHLRAGARLRLRHQQDLITAAHADRSEP